MNNRSTIDNNGITKNSSLEITAQLRGGSSSSMDIRNYFTPKNYKKITRITPKTKNSNNTVTDETKEDKEIEECLRVVSWNVNSISTTLPELVNFVDEHKPDLVLL